MTPASPRGLSDWCLSCCLLFESWHCPQLGATFASFFLREFPSSFPHSSFPFISVHSSRFLHAREKEIKIGKMGRPDDAPPRYTDGISPSDAASSADDSGISLHTTSNSPPPLMANDRYFDDDAQLHDDLPPLYTDHEADSVAVADPLIPTGVPPLGVTPFRSSANSGKTYLIDSRLDTDPTFLQSQLEILSHSPPRPICQVRGTHKETKRSSSSSNSDKEETVTVVDFDLEVELTALLYTDIRTQSSWKQLTTAGNLDKVRRGTIFAKRAPGFGGNTSTSETGTPMVSEWCHRYCASSAGLKSFTLERRVTGWDFEHLRRKLEKLIRDTNYRGHLQVSFPVHNSKVEIYNDCRTSRWRLTKWIEILCYVTLMFIFTWPWLFFRTKRWETVYVSWPLRDAQTGRYASMSEDEWYNMWARAIQSAALARRQGMLDQGDIAGADAALAGVVQAGVEAMGLNARAVGAVQAGVEAMGFVNRSFGWGGDDTRSGSGNRRSGLPSLTRNRR